MFRAKLSVVSALSAAGFAVLLAGCSTTEVDKTVGWSPNKIYAEAKDEMSSGAFDKAVPLFEKLEGRAAGTPLAQQAQLDKVVVEADEALEVQRIVQRRAGRVQLNETVQRGNRLDLFVVLVLRIGLVSFNDNLGLLSGLSRQDLSERDQKAAKDSFEAFRELTTRFPDSKYAPDARQRMTHIVNSLAQYEVHVARYYYSRGAYVAAINRAQTALNDYRDVPALEEAIYILMRSYDALGMEKLRDDARRVMESSYPKSDYLVQGFKAKSDPWWKMW